MQKKILGYPQQQCYDDGMWMETKAQQLQSHGYPQQFQGMHMKPGGFGKEYDHSMSNHHGQGSNLAGNHNMYHQDTMSNGYGHGHGHGGYGNNHGHGGGQKFPFGNNNSHSPNHFPNGGGVRPFSHGGGHGGHNYVSEHDEYEYESYKEEHVGSGGTKMDEMRYERHGTYGGDVQYANPYGYNNKPHGHGSHKINWTLKGV
jgi:hypothetical protein